MLRLLQIVQHFPITRWRRLGNDQAMVVWLVVLIAYIVLGLQLAVAWVWIKFQRVVFRDNAIRTVASQQSRPPSKSRPAASRLTG